MEYHYTNEIKNAVEKYAKEFDHSPVLIRAIIETESGYNPFAQRFEPNYKWLYSDKELSELLGCSRDTMRACQRMSLGLMQVMTAVAFELGFQDWPGKLFDIDLNVRYGCKHLRNLINRQKLTTVEEFYDCFNSGRANDGIINVKNQNRFLKIYHRLNNVSNF